MDHISVQANDFALQQEYDALTAQSGENGAVVCFTGLVRELGVTDQTIAMEIEHYPGMTEKSLKAIAAQARQRWPLSQVRIIHRVGRLETGDQIVFVGVSSQHRDAAFDACRFLMDYLKTEAPFWKKEITAEGELWVEANEKDAIAKEKWEKN